MARRHTHVELGTGKVVVQEETAIPGVMKTVPLDEGDVHPAINTFSRNGGMGSFDENTSEGGAAQREQEVREKAKIPARVQTTGLNAPKGGTTQLAADTGAMKGTGTAPAPVTAPAPAPAPNQAVK